MAGGEPSGLDLPQFAALNGPRDRRGTGLSPRGTTQAPSRRPRASSPRRRPVRPCRPPGGREFAPRSPRGSRFKKCRSVPQSVVVSTRTTASVSSAIDGPGASSHDFVRGSWYANAVMGGLLRATAASNAPYLSMPLRPAEALGPNVIFLVPTPFSGQRPPDASTSSTDLTGVPADARVGRKESLGRLINEYGFTAWPIRTWPRPSESRFLSPTPQIAHGLMDARRRPGMLRFPGVVAPPAGLIGAFPVQLIRR